MRKFDVHTGTAAPMRAANVDTDVIIPLIYTVTVPRAELGRYAFNDIRYDRDGKERPEFIFNQPSYRNASILIAYKNFGCGSSREWAVNAIDGMGIRVVIAPSFGDIFFSNCIKNGILPIKACDAQVEALLAEAEFVQGGSPFVVELLDQSITLPSGKVMEFDIDTAMKQRLIEGEDEISLTLRARSDIITFQQKLANEQPWIFEYSSGSTGPS